MAKRTPKTEAPIPAEKPISKKKAEVKAKPAEAEAPKPVKKSVAVKRVIIEVPVPVKETSNTIEVYSRFTDFDISPI
jgi:hypothetical protein